MPQHQRGGDPLAGKGSLLPVYQCLLSLRESIQLPRSKRRRTYRALQLRPNVGVVPGDRQRRSLLGKSEHVHVAAFVLRGAEGLLEGYAAIGRNEQALATRYDHHAFLLGSDGQGIVQQADVGQVLPLIANLQPTAVVDQFQRHRGTALLAEPHFASRRRTFVKTFFEGLGRSRPRRAFRRPANPGDLIDQRPPARRCFHLSLHRRALQPQRRAGSRGRRNTKKSRSRDTGQA